MAFLLTLVKWAILLCIGTVCVFWAIANKAPVEISLDPFPYVPPPVPLFTLFFLGALIGAVTVGIASGLRRVIWRQKAKSAETKVSKLEAEVAEWKTKCDALSVRREEVLLQLDQAQSPALLGGPDNPKPASSQDAA